MTLRIARFETIANPPEALRLQRLADITAQRPNEPAGLRSVRAAPAFLPSGPDGRYQPVLVPYA
jgi:hypothetical protein